MPHSRLVLHVILPICAVVLIIATFVDVLHESHPPGLSQTAAVDNALSHSYDSLKNFIDIVIRAPLLPKEQQVPLPDSTFLPPSYYARDPRGAIEVFRKDGIVVCRVYVACREHSSQISFPAWMKKHSRILSDTCALSNFRFVNLSRLVNNIRSNKGVYDWLAPRLPAPALPAFVSSALSKFYAPNNASKSKLVQSKNVKRSCYSPRNATQSNSSVCGMDPEPRISRPLFILDSEVMNPSINTNSEFEEALQFAVGNNHATEATIVSLTSDDLDGNRFCVRSIISAPSADHEAGETIASPTILEYSAQKHSIAVKETLNDADRIIEDEMKRGVEIKRPISSENGEQKRDKENTKMSPEPKSLS